MHDSEQFIREAIESVMAQTYQDWELLVVDDDSTDNSFAIASEYTEKDKRIKVLHNEQCIGMPSAPRNTGIREAKGRFIAFLDSDDVWFPQKLEQQLPLFEEKNVAIVYSNYEKFEEDGKRNNRIVKAPSTANYELLLKGNVIGNLTSIYDRSKTGTVYMQHLHHEDYVMWLSILKKGFIAKSTETTLGGYRLHKASVSSQKMIVIAWQWGVYRDVEHFSLLRSSYYFIFYAFKALAKSLI